MVSSLQSHTKQVCQYPNFTKNTGFETNLSTPENDCFQGSLNPISGTQKHQ